MPPKSAPQDGPESAPEPWKAFQVRLRSPELKRDAVLQTAAHLFLERGYGKTSMVLLAARLKVTKPALYYYFHNKEEILVECYRAGIAKIESHLQRSSAEGGSGFDQLRQYVHSYAMAVLTHYFGRCVAMVDDAELSPEGQREVRGLKRRMDLAMRGMVKEGIEDGSIAPCNPKLVSFAIAGAINWIGTWYEPGGDLPSEEIAREFTQMLTGGLAASTLSGKRLGGGREAHIPA